MFNFQGLAGQKTVENFDIKVLAASKIKLSAKAVETIGLKETTGVFMDKETTTGIFWIAAVPGGKSLSKQNTFGHKVLNQSLGEQTEWDIDVAGVKEFEGVQYFPLTKVKSAPIVEEATVVEDVKVEATVEVAQEEAVEKGVEELAAKTDAKTSQFAS